MSQTSFTNKCDILADLWMTYRHDEEFADFIEYADLGLPLAYAISNGIVETTEQSTNFINEAFDLFIAGLNIVDEGFNSLDEILDSQA